MSFKADHFSIDLETLGTDSDAAIIAIGVAQFDPMLSKLGQNFYREIDFDTAIKSGSINAATLFWWMQQGEKARRIFDKDRAKVALSVALYELREWMRKLSNDPIVWGNGATFDISILEHAYRHRAVGLTHPWSYKNIRDMRTAVDMAQFDVTSWPFPKRAVLHNALDDATIQAGIIAACWQKVRKAAALPIIVKQPVDDDEL